MYFNIYLRELPPGAPVSSHNPLVLGKGHFNDFTHKGQFTGQTQIHIKFMLLTLKFERCGHLPGRECLKSGSFFFFLA